MIASKDFKTVTQKFKAGDSVEDCEDIGVWIDRGFVVDDTPTPPALPDDE